LFFMENDNAYPDQLVAPAMVCTATTRDAAAQRLRARIIVATPRVRGAGWRRAWRPGTADAQGMAPAATSRRGGVRRAGQCGRHDRNSCAGKTPVRGQAQRPAQHGAVGYFAIAGATGATGPARGAPERWRSAGVRSTWRRTGNTETGGRQRHAGAGHHRRRWLRRAMRFPADRTTAGTTPAFCLGTQLR